MLHQEYVALEVNFPLHILSVGQGGLVGDRVRARTNVLGVARNEVLRPLNVLELKLLTVLSEVLVHVRPQDCVELLEAKPSLLLHVGGASVR